MLYHAPLSCYCLYHCPSPPRLHHSFPTRRSSDLAVAEDHTSSLGLILPSSITTVSPNGWAGWGSTTCANPRAFLTKETASHADRKSTRLNSSHTVISYAVFCLKKKISEHIQAQPS